MVEIPITELEAATLRHVIDDLVTRDGTDYGAEERTREQKTSALMRQLESGEAKLVFDPGDRDDRLDDRSGVSARDQSSAVTTPKVFLGQSDRDRGREVLVEQ